MLQRKALYFISLFFGSHQNNVAHFCHHFLLHCLIGLASSSSSLREFPQIKISSSTIFCILLLLRIFLSSYLLLLLLIHGKGVLSHSLFIGSNRLHFPLPLPLLLICHFSVNTRQECRNVYIVHLVSANLLKSAAKTFLSM